MLRGLVELIAPYAPEGRKGRPPFNYRFGQRQSLVSPKWTTATSLEPSLIVRRLSTASGRERHFAQDPESSRWLV